MTFALSAALGLLLLLAILLQGGQREELEVLFESEESISVSGGPVFNQIKWLNGKDKDIWMMNQSHFGIAASAKNWDRLAIVIDKTVSPKTARFYQLEPGPLEWKKGLKVLPLKVSCYLCHSNGPRAIRPDFSSSLAELSLAKRVKIQYLNLRMKLYGRVVPHSDHGVNDTTAGQPFRYLSDFENEPLVVKTCTLCHRDSGFFARGALKRQNLPTIKFLLDKGHMPPFGLTLSLEENAQLENFMEGF